MKYTIKRLHVSDLEDFRKLLVVFAHVFELSPNNRVIPTPYLENLLSKPDFYAIGAYDGFEVIGGVTGYELVLPDQKKELYVYDVAVNEKYQRKGVATAIIHELKASARENGVSTLFVEAELKDSGAVDFYRSLGAEQVEVMHFNISTD